jgi:hypothetical protein
MVRIDLVVFGLGTAATGTEPNNRSMLRALAREGGQLHDPQVVDVGVQPLDGGQDVPPDLIEFDKPPNTCGQLGLRGGYP